ncbi:2-phosphoxylose phosphatase 1 [Dermacentor variabilis]|uniref:2-phosphoxylose phosphatase 1 n=1 Tax=Dermacentor variabilis TaxID=34621 RepID=UPI003F5AFF96
MVSLVLWVTKFLARQRLLFASFIVIWIVGMAITICLIGRTDDAKAKYPDTTAVLYNAGQHNMQLSHSLTKAKAMKYCNPYNSISLWQEGKVPSNNFTLEAVAIMVRHGERMPLRRVRNQHLLGCRRPPSTSSPSSSRSSPLNSFVSLITKHPLLPLKNIFATIATHPNQSNCVEGQLTWEGVVQHVNMGASLHDAYHTGPWRLLPDDWDARSVKLYSTVFSRTYQSALAFLYGFLPQFSFDRLHLVPSRDINFCMGPHCACPQLKTYERLFTRKTKVMLKNHLAVVQLLNTLGKVLSPQGNNSEFVAPRPIMDGLMGFVCQRKPLPCADHHCATMEHVGNVISYVDWEGRQLSQDLSFRRSSILKAHYLLARIHRGLRDFMDGTSKTKFLFFSGHDINLIPVASTLGFDDGTIPPYASRIVLEAYSNAKKERFIRVLYNGKDMTRHTHFCKSIRAGVDMELCPFGNFTTFLQQDVFKLFSAKSFAAACGLDGVRSTPTAASPV